MYDLLRFWDLSPEERIAPPGVAPGKVTLTAAIQRKVSSTAPAAEVPAAEAPEVPGAPGAAAPLAGSFAESLGAREVSATGMPAAVQTKMERAFDFDFSSVRIHQGADAEAVGARAFTRGTDIHFAPGEYAPHDPGGQELLGHELAHVVQQSAGRVAATAQAKGLALNDDTALEQEADEQGARAARGEAVGSGRGAAATSSGGVLQRARNGKKRQNPNVKGYPTMEGDDLAEGDIPFSAECYALIIEGIIPALNDLGPDALKEDPRDGTPTGFMIGVAQTSTGALVGSTSGAAPDGVVDVMRRFCHRVVRSNVPRDDANAFIEDHDDAAREPKLGRFKISNHNEDGGMAGFCAAFKILYANPMLTFVGMAEVVYAPTHKPQPKIASGDGTVLAYEHGDPAPSCATCRAAMHGLLERGLRMRTPKPKKVSTGATEQELLEINKYKLLGYADSIATIPRELLALLGDLSGAQHKAAGGLLKTLGVNLESPMATAAAFVRDDIDMLATDGELMKLLKSVADSMAEVTRLLSMSVNAATKEGRTGTEGLMRSYVSNLEALQRAAEQLQAHVASLLVEDEGTGASSGGGGGGTLGSLLPKDVDQDVIEALAKWLENPVPSEISGIEGAVFDMEMNGVVDIFDQDNDLWFLDLATGTLTKEEQDEPDEPDEPSTKSAKSTKSTTPKVNVAELADSLIMKLKGQETFTVAVGAICTYMQVTNASDYGNNCLIYSIANAAKVEVTAEQIVEIRKRVGEPDDYLGTWCIPDIVAVLGVGRPIIVIRTLGHDGSARFSVEHLGQGVDPIYLINANNIHFGSGAVNPAFNVQNADLDDDVAIEFVAA